MEANIWHEFLFECVKAVFWRVLHDPQPHDPCRLNRRLITMGVSAFCPRLRTKAHNYTSCCIHPPARSAQSWSCRKLRVAHLWSLSGQRRAHPNREGGLHGADLHISTVDTRPDLEIWRPLQKENNLSFRPHPQLLPTTLKTPVVVIYPPCSGEPHPRNDRRRPVPRGQLAQPKEKKTSTQPLHSPSLLSKWQQHSETFSKTVMK